MVVLGIKRWSKHPTGLTNSGFPLRILQAHSKSGNLLRTTPVYTVVEFFHSVSDPKVTMGHLANHDDYEQWERSVLRVHGPDQGFLRHGAPGASENRDMHHLYDVLVLIRKSPFAESPHSACNPIVISP